MLRLESPSPDQRYTERTCMPPFVPVLIHAVPILLRRCGGTSSMPFVFIPMWRLHRTPTPADTPPLSVVVASLILAFHFLDLALASALAQLSLSLTLVS